MTALSQKDKRLGITDKHHLADKKIAEGETIFRIDIGVTRLFIGEVDTDSARGSLCFLCPFIGRFHNAWPTSCNNPKATTRNLFGHHHGEFIGGRPWCCTGRAKDRDGGANIGHCLKSIDKFSENPKDSPRIKMRFFWCLAHASR